MRGFKILMYHEIIDKKDFQEKNKSEIVVNQQYKDILPNFLFTYLHDFEEHIKYLVENNFKTLGLNDIYNYYYNEVELPKKSVLITFDDMFVSVRKYAYPILKKYRLNAVGFVVLDWLFKEKVAYDKEKSVCMTFEDLKIMQDVFQYANHTNSMHTKVIDSTGKRITAIQMTTEEKFIEDLNLCEDFVDYKGAFAYPFGEYVDENIEWLKSNGYKLGFTSKPGINNNGTNPLLLNRDAVILGTDLESFKCLLDTE